MAEAEPRSRRAERATWQEQSISRAHLPNRVAMRAGHMQQVLIPRARALVGLVLIAGGVDAREGPETGWGMALEISRSIAGPCRTETGGFAIDVGARGGSETALALSAGYSVVAVECSEDAFAPFAKLHVNNPKVTAHYGCASDHSGNATFHLASDSSSLMHHAVSTRKDEIKKRPKGNRSKTMTVPLLVVDELLMAANRKNEPVCAVKVDVQGNELGVFKGMPQIFANHRPVLYFEHAIVNLGRVASKQLIPFIQAQGYHCYPHTAKMCEYCNVLCTPQRTPGKMLPDPRPAAALKASRPAAARAAYKAPTLKKPVKPAELRFSWIRAANFLLATCVGSFFMAFFWLWWKSDKS